MQQKHETHDTPESQQTSRSPTPLQRLLRSNLEIETAQSLGEALLPFLLAAAEACWFDGLLIGLAGVDFVHTTDALLPFWGAPLLFCVALWLFQRALYQEASVDADQEKSTRFSRGFSWLFGMVALLTIGLVWLRIYAGNYFLLDPRWLLAFFNDLLSLNDHFSQILAIAIVAAYFCWRSSRLAQMRIEPGHVKRQIWVGLLVLLGAILLRARLGQAGGNFDDIVLVLLMPAFLYFALSAHALARTAFIRRTHPFGLDGNIVSQERAMLSIIGSLGLILLLLTLLGAASFSATFWSSLQPTAQLFASAYSWLTDKLALALGWILQPLFWLVEWLQTFKHDSKEPPTQSQTSRFPPGHLNVTPPALIFATRVLLPLLILLILLLFIWIATRRRKRVRITRRRASGDIHESIWSWQLFWNQLKAFFAALFNRKKAGEEEAAVSPDELPAEPAARTIREIYRALLKRAANSGHVRRRNETPYEFQHRLNQFRPAHNEPQLGQITEAYALTRYGGLAPDEFELASIRRSWDELERKWDTPEQ